MAAAQSALFLMQGQYGMGMGMAPALQTMNLQRLFLLILISFVRYKVY